MDPEKFSKSVKLKVAYFDCDSASSDGSGTFYKTNELMQLHVGTRQDTKALIIVTFLILLSMKQSLEQAKSHELEAFKYYLAFASYICHF